MNTINTNYLHNQKLNFTSKLDIAHEVYTASVDNKLSNKAKTLMAALDLHIERVWRDIKKEGYNSESPLFVHNDNNELVTIKPIYSQRYPAILIEKTDGKYNHKIMIDRKSPNNFRYEKTVYTDYGSATLKSYNSRTEEDQKINNIVERIIDTSVAHVLPVKILRQFFPDSAFHFCGGKLTII